MIRLTGNKYIEMDASAGAGGVQFLRLNQGVTVSIPDCNLHKPATLQFEPPFESIAIGFSLSGRMEVRPDGGKTATNLATLCRT